MQKRKFQSLSAGHFYYFFLSKNGFLPDILNGMPIKTTILSFIFSASLNKKHNREKQSHINISHRLAPIYTNGKEYWPLLPGCYSYKLSSKTILKA